MPIFKKSNNFSKNFNKKTPFKKEEEISDFERFSRMGGKKDEEKDKETSWRDPYDMEKNIKKYSKKSKPSNKKTATEKAIEIKQKPISFPTPNDSANIPMVDLPEKQEFKG